MPNKVPGDANAAGLQIYLENNCFGAVAGGRAPLVAGVEQAGTLRFKQKATGIELAQNSGESVQAGEPGQTWRLERKRAK